MIPQGLRPAEREGSRSAWRAPTGPADTAPREIDVLFAMKIRTIVLERFSPSRAGAERR